VFGVFQLQITAMRVSFRHVLSRVALIVVCNAAMTLFGPMCAANTDSIFADGFDHLYFVVPYSSGGSIPPSPATREFAMSTQLGQVDVGFIMDTTGSMGGEIASLKSGLSTVIIPGLSSLPNVAIGVAGHDDVPYSTYGDPMYDLPFYTPSTGYVTTVTIDAQNAANSLTLHSGLDQPESQVLAIHDALTGAGIVWPGGSVAGVTPPAGTFGALHFRSAALPIVVEITDAPHHNGKRALDKTGSTYDSAFQYTYSFATWTVDDTVAALNGLGAKLVGIAADNGSRGTGTTDPYGFLAYLTDKTSSDVPPGAFSGGTCNTGVSGAQVAADGPNVAGVQQCRTVFSINTTGSGLGSAVVSGISAVANSAQFDVFVLAYADPAESLDSVDAFVLSVDPDPAGGTDAETNAVCLTIPLPQLVDNFSGPKAIPGADGINDTITQTNVNLLYCFQVTAKANSTVPATSAPQFFHAWLRILAIAPTRTIALGPDRELFFVVPPQ
jgi:hypothetical protein